MVWRPCEGWGHIAAVTETEKRDRYQIAWQKTSALLEGETDAIAAMATICSILAGEFPYFYWTGFYRMIDGELVIGPYQGTPGCLRIALSRGVCGAAASKGETVMVEDVHEFPGHIACDPNSRSEIVVPVKNKLGEVMAVLDVDAAVPSAFDCEDQTGLEKMVQLLAKVV